MSHDSMRVFTPYYAVRVSRGLADIFGLDCMRTPAPPIFRVYFFSGEGTEAFFWVKILYVC